MLKREVYSILFCGIGGQGVLKLAELCCYAAFFAGYHVKKSEVHGMAQRGGSVESHVRFGKKVYSPLIPQGGVDYFVPLHPDEHKRLSKFTGKRCFDLFPFLERAKDAMDNARFVNTCMAGILSVFLPIKEKYWMDAMEYLWKGEILLHNREAFVIGRKLVFNDKNYQEVADDLE